MPFGPDFWKSVVDMGVGAVVALIILFYGFRFLRVWQKETTDAQTKIAGVMDNHLSTIEKSLAILLEKMTNHDKDEHQMWTIMIERFVPAPKKIPARVKRARRRV